MGLCTSRKKHLEPEDLPPRIYPLKSTDFPISDLSEKSFLSSYSVHEKIGSGGFGTVFRITHIRTNTQLVAKTIKTDADNKVPAEITLMRDVDHPNIIRLLDYYTTARHILLILEFLPDCMDLFDYIDLKTLLPEKNMKFILVQLTSALSYLHEEKQIAHLDVKPENILIQPTTGDVRLIDFGAAQRIRPELHTTFQGTRQYASPEILFNERFDPVAADVWALGVTLYKMVTGRLPFKRSRDYLKPLSLRCSGVSALCLETIAIILNPNPDLRPTSIRDIRNCSWMKT
jgi:serine/threonine protein kinase